MYDPSIASDNRSSRLSTLTLSEKAKWKMSPKWRLPSSHNELTD